MRVQRATTALMPARIASSMLTPSATVQVRLGLRPHLTAELLRQRPVPVVRVAHPLPGAVELVDQLREPAADDAQHLLRVLVREIGHLDCGYGSLSFCIGLHPVPARLTVPARDMPTTSYGPAAL
jgi:hypothetical protein